MKYTADQLKAAIVNARDAKDFDAVEKFNSILSVLRDEQQKPSYAQGLAQQAGQGMSMGFMDEAIAKLIPFVYHTLNPDAPEVPEGEKWLLQQQRQQAEQFAGDHPFASGAARMGGAALGGGAAIGAAARMAPGAAAAVGQNVPAWMQSTGAGAMGGGLTAVGEAEDASLGDFVGGAGVGAAGGAFAHALIKRIGPAATRWVYSKLATAPRDQTKRVLSGALQDAGVTPREIDDFVRLLGPDGVAADAPALRGVALASSALPGAPRDLIQNTLKERDLLQQQRVWDTIRRQLRVSGKIQPSLRALEAAQKAAAKENYDEAYRHSIPRTEELLDILKDKKIAKAVRHAEDLSERGKGLQSLKLVAGKTGEEQLVDFPDMEGWDLIQRGLRSKAEAAFKNGSPLSNSQARAYVKLRHELLTELDRENPAFRIARQTYAKDEALKRAMKDGQNVLKADTELLEELWGDYTASERQAFMLGVGKELYSQIFERPETWDVTKNRMFTVPEVKKRLEKVLGSSATKSIMDEAKRLAHMRSTKQLIGSRSPTGDIESMMKRMARQEDASVGQAFMEGELSPMGLMRRGVRALSEGPDPRTVEGVGTALFTQGMSLDRTLQPGALAKTSSFLGAPFIAAANQSPVAVGAQTGGFLGPALYDALGPYFE